MPSIMQKPASDIKCSLNWGNFEHFSASAFNNSFTNCSRDMKQKRSAKLEKLEKKVNIFFLNG